MSSRLGSLKVVVNPLLRGVSLPPFYVPSTAPVSTQAVDVGGLLLLRIPLQFSP